MRPATKLALGVSAALAVILLAAFFVIKSRGAPRAPASEIVMQSDLKNLALLQSFLKDSTGRHTDSFEALDYRLSEGVTRPDIALTPDGYTIAIGYRGSRRRCVLYEGSTAITPATKPGTPACADSLTEARRVP